MLTAEGVTVHLGSAEVLHDVDIRLAPHEIVGIMGPNGAGKSTLIRTLVGLTPFAGSVTVDGRELSRLSIADRSRRLGYVPQRSELRTGQSVEGVVGMGRFSHRGPLASWTAEDRRQVRTALTACDLDHLRARSFVTLSEGERRRVLMARALASGARCLLLDEPTAALDVAHVIDLFDRLTELRTRGYAIAVVLHDLNEAFRLVDRGVVLKAGRVAVSGLRDEIFHPDTIRRVFDVDIVFNGAFAFRRAEASP